MAVQELAKAAFLLVENEDRRNARKRGAGSLVDAISQCSASKVKGTVEGFVGADSDAEGGVCSLLPQLNCLHRANIVRGEDASNVAAIPAQKQATYLKEVNRVPVELHIAVQCIKRRGNG